MLLEQLKNQQKYVGFSIGVKFDIRQVIYVKSNQFTILKDYPIIVLDDKDVHKSP